VPYSETLTFYTHARVQGVESLLEVRFPTVIGLGKLSWADISEFWTGHEINDILDTMDPEQSDGHVNRKSRTVLDRQKMMGSFAAAYHIVSQGFVNPEFNPTAAVRQAADRLRRDGGLTELDAQRLGAADPHSRFRSTFPSSSLGVNEARASLG
jgi:hypothetical protein